VASNADISAADLALLAADKPILAANAGYNPSVVEWRNGGSWAAGSDETETANPTVRAYDGKGHLDTRPDTARTTHYLLFDFGAAGIEFDFVAILGHNFGTIGGLTVTAECSTTSSYGSPVALSSWSPAGSNNRLIDLSLSAGTAQRYSAYRYARIGMTKGSTFTPQIGEVIWGRRRQLKHKSNIGGGFDPDAHMALVTDNRSLSGVLTRYSWADGQRALAGNFNPHEDAYKDDIKAWGVQVGYGARSLVYIEDPSTTPEGFLLMYMVDPRFSFPLQGPLSRLFELTALEQPPFLAGQV